MLVIHQSQVLLIPTTSGRLLFPGKDDPVNYKSPLLELLFSATIATIDGGDRICRLLILFIKCLSLTWISDKYCICYFILRSF